MPESSTPDRSRRPSDLKKHMTLVVGSNDKPMGYPLHILNAQDTATLMMLGRVKEVKSSPHVILRGEREPYPLPSVLRLSRSVESLHNVLTGRTVRFSRTHLYIRDGGICQYTGEKLSWYHEDERKRASFDHVLPVKRYGETEWENAVLASAWVNNAFKGSKTLLEANIWPRRRPWVPTEQDMLSLSIKLWMDNPEMPEDWLPYLERVTPSLFVQRLWDNPLELDYTPFENLPIQQLLAA